MKIIVCKNIVKGTKLSEGNKNEVSEISESTRVKFVKLQKGRWQRCRNDFYELVGIKFVKFQK